MSLEFDERDRVSVLRDLDSGDDDVRRLAVERAAALPRQEAIALLVDRLGDPSWRVRKAAVERLVACRESDGAIGALIGALSDGENPGRRNAAVEALVETGARAVPHLVEARASDDSDVRKLIVDAMAGIGDRRATLPLIELLADTDPNVRAASTDALGAIGGVEVVEPLLAAAIRRDEDQLVRFSALHALSTLEIPIGARELSPVLDDAMLRPAGLALLGHEDDEEALAVLLKGVVSSSRPTREAAMRSLLRLLAGVDGARADDVETRIREAATSTPELVASAIERLADADLALRLSLIQFLGVVRAPDAVVPVLRTASDEALEQVALGTLEALGEMAEEAIDAAWDELGTELRRSACVLFGRGRGERSGARLLLALDDVAPELRAAAARSIGERRLAAGVPQLVRCLETAAAEDDFESDEELAALTDSLIQLARPGEGSADLTERAIALLTSSIDGAAESVRIAVARVLGRIGRREDAEIVALLLKDPSGAVRRAAVEALARLEPDTDVEPLRLALADESCEVRIAAAGALGASENPAVLDDLRQLAEDADPRVRAAAVRAAVSRFTRRDGDARDAALALARVALSDEAAVALAAVSALGEIGGSDVELIAPVLARNEPELLLEAIRAVGAHGASETVERLSSLVSDPDWSVRAEAIQTLAERGASRAVPAILRRLELEQDDFVRGAILRALERLEG